MVLRRRKRVRKTAASRWRRVFRAGTKLHPAKGVKYMIANSIQGLRWARKFGKKSADRDLRFTKDKVCVVVHWSLLYKEGIAVPHNYRIEDHTWEEVQQLTGPWGLKIHTLWQDIDELSRLHMWPWFEPKSNDPKFHTKEFWDTVVAYCHKRGITKYRGYALKANAKAVPAMRAAGIPANVLSK